MFLHFSYFSFFLAFMLTLIQILVHQLTVESLSKTFILNYYL